MAASAISVAMSGSSFLASTIILCTSSGVGAAFGVCWTWGGVAWSAGLDDNSRLFTPQAQAADTRAWTLRTEAGDRGRSRVGGRRRGRRAPHH